MSKAVASSAPGSVYTFYSYKGGVGRSMAVVNIGVLLALAGKRVLLVDWDLEAPGLEVFFQKAAQLEGDPQSVPGIVDLLEAQAAGRYLSWKECRLNAAFLGTSLDIISAGSRTTDYRKRIQQLDWNALYREHAIGNFIDELRVEWRSPENYDVVLVDSRTGVTDIGDICTVLLPDAIVLMFVTNHQSVEGAKNVMTRAVKARKSLPVNRAKLLCIPLLGRDEIYNEYDKSVEWKKMLAEEFAEFYREWLPREVKPADALNRLFIPYVSNWSFGDRIPVLESSRETQDPTTIGAAYNRVANLLASGLDWYGLEGQVTVAELQGAQVELLREREQTINLKEQHEKELAILERDRQELARREAQEREEKAMLEEQRRIELEEAETRHRTELIAMRSKERRRLISAVVWSLLIAMSILLGSYAWIMNTRKPQPVSELLRLGWTITTGPESGTFTFVGDPPFGQSHTFLRQLRVNKVLISNVSSISGIEAWKDLHISELQLKGRVSDLSPLETLSTLTILVLNETNTSELSPLRNLNRLSELDVASTRVTDLSPLAGLRNLSVLNLADTRITDLSPLADLRGLSTLNLAGTRVVDPRPLGNLT
ncbi:MAG: AAA family ATPase, partial [Silvibacterium sp.]